MHPSSALLRLLVLVVASILACAHASVDMTEGPGFSENGTGTRTEDCQQLQLKNGSFHWKDALDDPEWVKDWSYYNYSSEEWKARDSAVQSGGKIYDPLSFAGGPNDTYAISFYLSTEVAVSAAQARNGSLINVAKVDGNPEYRTLMAGIQQDLKGNRSLFYATPLWRWPELFSSSRYTDQMIYFRRLLNYVKGQGNHTPPSPNPIPIFKDVLSNLKQATEDALAIRMQPASEDWPPEYVRGKIRVILGAPWELNHTLSQALWIATDELGMVNRWHYRQLTQLPGMDWSDHANDVRDYSGEPGTVFAFEQARKLVEMKVFDPIYRYGDFVCGTYLVKEDSRIMEEMKANGTWVEPPQKGVLELPCRDFSEGFWTFLTVTPEYHQDMDYWKWYFGYL